MLYRVFALALGFVAYANAQDGPVVFKSDVALARVDAQVLDRNGRAITGLQRDDFVLRVDGHVVPIRSFASENMPIDILLLLDVSASMDPHVQRIASAAQEALNELAANDRIAIMVFDTAARLRLPFRTSHGEITAELNRLLRSETFAGGTRITHALLDAANYVQRQARPDARRAIVILTDDETQDEENEPRVESALARANAVLSFLQAPYQPSGMATGPRRHGTWGGGGGWPGTGWPGGGGIGFPGGGPVVLGPGRTGGADPSHTAGTATIASDSGGDTIPVDEPSSLADTLARLRQRYTFNFYFPNGSSDHSAVRVGFSEEARIRFMDAEVRSRRVFLAGGAAAETVVTREQPPDNTTDAIQAPDNTDISAPTASKHRRVAVNEESGEHVNTIGPDEDPSSPPTAAPEKQPDPPPQPASGGWPRANQQNQNPN